MSGSYSLPDKLPVEPGESMNGYITRYACLYKFQTSEQLFARLGMRRRYVPTIAALDPDSREGMSIGAFLNLSTEEHRRMSTWHPANKAVNILGKKVSEEMVGVARRQVCPACLRQSLYHRSLWMVRALPACVVHRIWLVRKCPSCGQPLGWKGGALHCCDNKDCGFDLTLSDGPELEAVDLNGIARISELLNGASHASGLEVDEVLRATIELGSRLMKYPLPRRIASFIESSRDLLPAVLSAGWKAFNPWPGAFRELLAEVLATNVGDRKAVPMSEAFGSLFDFTRPACRAWGRPFAVELGDFAMGRLDVAIRLDTARRNCSGARENVRHLSMTEAAAHLGVSVDTLNRTSLRLGIDATPPKQGKVRLLKPSEIRRLEAAQTANFDAVSLLEAAEMLGVSIPTLYRLIRAGSLVDIPVVARVKIRHAVRRAEINALLQKFEAAASGAPIIAGPGPGHFIPGHLRGRSSPGTLDLVRNVLSGVLRPVGIWPDGPGLKRFLFAFDEVRVVRPKMVYVIKKFAQVAPETQRLTDREGK